LAGCQQGEMREWLKRPVSKTGMPQGIGSSNLPLSADLSASVYRPFPLGGRVEIELAECQKHLTKRYF
jgi:hypothetical protein